MDFEAIFILQKKLDGGVKWCLCERISQPLRMFDQNSNYLIGQETLSTIGNTITSKIGTYAHAIG